MSNNIPKASVKEIIFGQWDHASAITFYSDNLKPEGIFIKINGSYRKVFA